MIPDTLSATAEYGSYVLHYRGGGLDYVSVYRGHVGGKPLADYDGGGWCIDCPVPQDVLDEAERYWRGFDD